MFVYKAVPSPLTTMRGESGAVTNKGSQLNIDTIKNENV
jgi:hypothetical protein